MLKNDGQTNRSIGHLIAFMFKNPHNIEYHDNNFVIQDT